jgi:hypothetical protein
VQRAGYRRGTQKVSAEGERSNVLYCMHNTLQSAQAAKKKMHRVSAQNEDSRFKQAAANFLLQRYRSARQSPVKCILGSAARSLKNVSSLGLRKHSRICGQRSKMAFQG